MVKNDWKLDKEFEEIEDIIENYGLWDQSLENKLNTYVSNNDYLVIEKASKNYLKDFINESKKLYDVFNDKKATELITIENFIIDGKNFTKSLNYVNETYEKLIDIKKSITSMHADYKIKSYLEKKVNAYYLDYYLDFVLSVNDEGLAIINDSIEDYVEFLEEEKKLFNFLARNQNSWYIENNLIYFNNIFLLHEYNDLFDDLNDFNYKNTLSL